MRRKGFTLIELLSIIVVLGIISMITVPIILNQIEKSRIKSFELGVQNTLESAKTYVIENYSENDFPTGGISVTSKLLSLKNNDYTGGIIKKDKEGVIIVENVTNGKYCANGSKNDLEITKGDCSGNDGTAPDVKIKLIDTKSNSLTYKLTMSDSGSGIQKYSYCYQNCNTESNWKTTTYDTYPKEEKIVPITLTNLKTNTKYTLQVKVIDGNGNTKEITSEGEITSLIEAPKFEISTSNYSSKKTVKIIYPKYQEGYSYSYEYMSNGIIHEKVYLRSNENEISFEVKETMIVTAYIKYDGGIITSTLNIVNIDAEAPKFDIKIEPDGWSKSKKVTIINAKDAGSGLSYKPYQFDNGSWTNNDQKTYTQNGKIELKVRDKLGNVATYTGDEKITNIDTEAPTCRIKVTGDTKIINGNVWYVSKPTITVTYKDYYINEAGKKVEGGSGIQSSTMSITTGNINSSTSVTLNKNGEYIKRIKDGMHYISFSVKDNAGNEKTSACEISLNVDSVQPSIVAKTTENVVDYNTNAVLLDTYFTIKQKYGTTGGTTTCYTVTNTGDQVKTNNNQLTLGINKIKCKMVGNNGKTSEATTIIRHKYTSSNFTCPSGWTIDGNTCRGGTGKCLEYNQKKDSSCGCKTWNCKTRYTKDDGITSTTCSDIKYCNGTCQTYKATCQ